MLQNKIAVLSRTFSNTTELAAGLSETFSSVRFNTDKKLAGAEIAAFIGDAEGAIVALEDITDEVLAACPNLKIISKFGVGLDNVDIEACKRRGIAVGWTGGVNRLSVAEMTLGFMLALTRNLFKTSLELKRGVWDKDGGTQLSGKTVGILGAGNVGKEVIRLLKPFGCTVLACDLIEQSNFYAAEGVIEVGKDELFERSDILSLHAPLTAETRHIVDGAALGRMKKSAFLINTARGPLVDYGELKKALLSGQIAGAAVDVYDEEPPQDQELLSLENLICTPHIGGNSREAVLAMGQSAVRHLQEHFLSH